MILYLVRRLFCTEFYQTLIMDLQISPSSNPYPRWLANFGLFLATALFLVLLWEWLSIGILQDAGKIKEYSFGSGSMLEKGGSNYMSAAIYARASLVGAIAGIPGIIAFWSAVKRPSLKSMLLAYTIWLTITWTASLV